MQRFHSDDHWLLRLERGEDVLGTLEDFARTHAIGHASIHGIGAVEGVKLGAYDLAEREYVTQELDGGYEVISLLGNLGWVEDEPFPHLHVLLADLQGRCVGGHLFAGTVHITLELFVHPQRARLPRVHDEETGLKLWNLADIPPEGAR